MAALINTMIIMGIVGIVIAVLAFFIWDIYKRRKNAKDTEGRVLLEITPDGGGRVYRVLCEAYKGEAKKIETKSRATFMATIFAKPPKGHAIDCYYLLPEHDYLDVYPSSALLKSQQVIVPKYYFTENDPCPKIPHDPSKWDSDRYTRITAAMAKLSKDESNLQVLVSEMSGVWNNIEEFVRKLKMIPLLMIGIAVNIFVSFIIGFITYQVGNNITTIMKFLTGGK